MISFIKRMFGANDGRCEALREKMLIEQKFIDQQLLEEEEKEVLKTGNMSCMHNIISINGNKEYNEGHQPNDLKNSCLRRKGIITALDTDQGVIDNFITFDSKACVNGFNDLNIGYKVEYLAYTKDDIMKVVKIEKVVEQFWGDEPIDSRLQSQINLLKDEAPTFFNTQHRNILGLVKERRKDDIIVDTDYKVMTVQLEDIEMEFVPKTGDRVQLVCTVQVDDSFVDKQGEILQVRRVEPSRMQRDEKCRVEGTYEEFAVLNNDAYVLFEDIPSSLTLHIGDIVKVDLIECERGNYIWRGIKLAILEKTFGLLKTIENPKISSTSENQAITFYGDVRCILVGTGQKKTITVQMKNNCDFDFKILEVELDKRRDILRLVEPASTGFRIKSKAELCLIFEVNAQFFGESTEYFAIKLEKFRIKKNITVIVTQTESEAVEAERRLSSAMVLPSFKGRNILQRSRHYAAQVWSKRSEVVPGESIATKRRFVAVRIGPHDIPERLIQTYLKTDGKIERQIAVETLYPCLKEHLSFGNYVQRFQLLLFLEEIEYYVNFRNYDRERAHFVRDHEYLSLTIENLAECRPSIVIGDSVRVSSPWTNEYSDARSFEGIVHKVLFNRILLKFNSSFQEKYNGEDYRLSFHHSRFIFRKQHHALQKITTHLGEQFLFPSKVHIRDHQQLEVRLDDNHKLYLYDSDLQWYNPFLNSVQKRAVFNILQGETNNMPYIIFGPPGTGKTVTLVETILQLVRNLPSSRLLVGTPSNSSADLITQRIVDSGVLKPGEFVRLVSQNLVEKDLIPYPLMPYCATVDIGSDGTCEDNMIVTSSGLKLHCQKKYLGRHRVTISTCSTLGNFLHMNFPANHFTHVLIDEAGQCTETECIVPISMVSKKRGQVILAGDPHQLQGIVISRYASEKGYSLSLLERILERTPYKKDLLRFMETSGYDPRLITKLIYNYRALPSIMNIYNELFYDGELKSVISEVDSRESALLKKLTPIIEMADENTPIAHGVFFHGIRSVNMQEDGSPSWYNPGEAKSIFIMTVKLYRNDIKPEDIGIVTPYMKQVKHLRSLFISADIAMPKIGSVEEFQGQERDIILISTVRSSECHLESDARYSLGFVCCMKRMNVAISRARTLMLIYGNPHLLALDECWRTLLKYAYKNDAYIGCDLPKVVTKDDDARSTHDSENDFNFR